jgi:hypothetical protein
MLLLNSLLDAATARYADSDTPGGQRAPEGSAHEIDFSNPAENLKAFVKLTGSLDPGVESCGWFGGTIYAVLGKDEAVKPLISVEGCGVNRIEQRGDNLYRIFNREFAVYKDLETGAYLDRWTNPLTDETVDVFPIQNRRVTAEIAPIHKQDFDGTMVEFPFSPPWIVMQGTAFNVLEVHTAFPNPLTPDEWPRESAGKINRTSEMFNRAANYAQLADPDTPHADSTGTWVRLSPWLPWMLMGQAEGHLMYRTFLKRVGDSTNLPGPLFEYMSKNYPDFLSAPASSAWGKPNDSSFSVYMENNEPAPPRDS